MKILQIINSLGTGGAEKLLLDSLPLYNQKGIEMDILLFWDNNFPFTSKLKDLSCCNVYILKHSENLKDIYSPSHIFKIQNIIKNYDLVHVHLFPAQYSVSIANRLNRKKVPLIFTEHSTSNRRLKNNFIKPFERWCYAQYEQIICITEEVKSIFDHYLNLNSKTSVIHNGVNLEDIRDAVYLHKQKINPHLEDGDKLIMQVSAFRYGKDQDTLVKALLYLPPNIKLLLVGEGPRKKEVSDFVSTQKLEDRVFFLGQRMDIPKLLKSVDVTVLSTYYEGFGLVAVEGMASGKPFVASDVAGVREIVKDAGILFQQGDEKELAHIIKNLLDNEEYSYSVVEKCMARAKQFDINIMVDQHIELYKKVFEKK